MSAFNLNIIKGSNPFCTKIFELLALILYPENRQFESPESKYMKVHAQIGREPFLLICGQGTWRYHRIWISNEWFRLFCYNMVHIGALIKAELQRQERSVTWFAKKLCCERTNVYSIFKRESIDTALLFRISSILHHNFFLYYTKELEQCDFYSTQT